MVEINEIILNIHLLMGTNLRGAGFVHKTKQFCCFMTSRYLLYAGSTPRERLFFRLSSQLHLKSLSFQNLKVHNF